MFKQQLIIIGVTMVLFSAVIVVFPPIDFTARGSGETMVAANVQNSLQNLIDTGATSTMLGIAAAEIPVKLIISKLYVNAAVLQVGVTTDGAMEVPKGPDEVAWYSLGPRPGNIGSSVISGHFGWKDGIPAVFDNLDKLRKGDKISVLDASGISTDFVVKEMRVFGENEDAQAVFGSSDGKAHLNLITCGGVWNKAEKSYSKRLVVFTDRE